ncbi:MAG: ABC transporter ATP-binding protein [Treponema sp.]|jgi:peptide/nickel transport system ATP-binding protein|nr:ABC transporter ATP-binding protein [Treponema sp.]
MTNPLLWVQGLSVGIKTGGKTLIAVDDISFKVGSGEIVGIVGESGCGKTLTALSIPRLLPGGMEILRGIILLNGLDTVTLSSKELCRIRGKDVSMVFQEHSSSLNPLRRVGSQIAESLELHGLREKKRLREAALEAMDKTGLPNAERLFMAYPHELSGGMRQRAMIALAAISGPKLLIADEPTTALDVTIQAQILSLLKTINRELGMSILFISHDLAVINQICDRVLVMYAGKIVEEGTVGNIFWHPVHEYTRGLMGSIPAKSMKGRPLANIPGKVPSLEEKQSTGCPFAPRCKRLLNRCFERFPEKTNLSENHGVYCYLADPDSEMEYVRL